MKKTNKMIAQRGILAKVNTFCAQTNYLGKKLD